MAVIAFFLLSSSPASAGCTKHDRSDCDLAQSCAQKACDMLEDANKYNPFPQAKRAVKRRVDDARKSISNSSNDQSSRDAKYNFGRLFALRNTMISMFGTLRNDALCSYIRCRAADNRA